MLTTNRYQCDQGNVGQIEDWLKNRGGIVIWESINISNPGASWTGPYLGPDGVPATKPNWQCGDKPARHITDMADVDVVTSCEYKRFHVGVRMGRQGFSLKVTDAGSRRIRDEVAKAQEKTGKNAWHEFDYSATEFDPRGKNAVIMVEGDCVPLTEWLERGRVVGYSH